MLTVSTFASAITFNIILKPSDGDSPFLALLYLSYANSLFCGAIMGCVLIKVSIELCKSSVDYVGEWKANITQTSPKWEKEVKDWKCKRDNWKKQRECKQENGEKSGGEWEFGRFEGLKLKCKGGPFETLLAWLCSEDDSEQLMKSIGHWILGVETGIVASILFVAVYLLLLSCKFFLHINGPFLAGTVIYWFFCGTMCFMALVLMSVGHAMRRRELEGDKTKQRFWILHNIFSYLGVLVYNFCSIRKVPGKAKKSQSTQINGVSVSMSSKEEKRKSMEQNC
ncbi:hypothetical protein N431DRAFT_471300 [Stipitochalara longipes BDJ]|nr:hypothetical protein N431DRAFT_471300 [Stipitochalara longipes BDJ]